MLASDLANKEFTGPVSNTDDLLFVEFYWEYPLDKWETESQGKEVRGPKTPYVRYGRPGDKNTIMEVAVMDHHKRRWAHRWMAWQMKEGLIDGEGTIPGWSIEDWSELNKEQILELRYMRFSTVEQIAGASDAQVQRMGMGGLALREKAKHALRNKMGADVKAEIEVRDEKISVLEENAKKMMDVINHLQSQMNAMAAPRISAETAQTIKRKYTKKAKTDSSEAAA